MNTERQQNETKIYEKSNSNPTQYQINCSIQWIFVGELNAYKRQILRLIHSKKIRDFYFVFSLAFAFAFELLDRNRTEYSHLSLTTITFILSIWAIYFTIADML